MTHDDLTRRTAIGMGASVAVVGLAACSSGDGAAKDTTSPGTSASSKAGSSGTTPAGTTVDKAKVPVGGGTVVSDAKIVVTQPTEGTYKAFTAVCPHKGCIVSTVADAKITCACHNSVFDAATGSVLSGPAPAGLAAKHVEVSGNTLTVS